MVCEIPIWKNDINGELGVGRLSEFYDNFLKAIFEQNPPQSAKDIAKRMHASQSTVCRHLEKLGKVCKLRVWIPHNLSEKNKDHP